MLQAIGLNQSYNGMKALAPLDRSIEPGQVFCLLGAGKTTTIHLFLNLIDATDGKALVDGVDVSGPPATARPYGRRSTLPLRWPRRHTHCRSTNRRPALDPKASNKFSRILVRLSSESMALLMAAHDLFRTKEAGAHVGNMKQGRLVARLTTEEIGHANLGWLYLEHMHR